MRCKVEYRSASKDVFKRFKLKHPNLKIDYNTWCTVIYTFNYYFRDHILETGDVCKFPYGFGDFTISKWKPKPTKILEDGREIINLPVDWKKTKEAGKKIYMFNNHTEGFKFKWCWFPYTARFYKSDIWSFKPSRVSSRMLKHYLNLSGQHHKYHEWNKI
jgi:hypothetical protein